LLLDLQPEGPAREVRLHNRAGQILGAEFLGLPAHGRHQLRALDAFREAREILDQRGE